MTMMNYVQPYTTITVAIQRKAHFVLKRLGHLFNQWVAAAIAYRARQADIVILRHLSDRELKDIGLCRGDIAAGLAEAAKSRIRRQQSERS